MSQLYLKSGNRFMLSDNRNVQVYDSLPVANYIVKFTMETGYFFEETDQFELPPKFYGTFLDYATRVKITYADRVSQGKSTGVLLKGEKGAGKTLLAKKLAIDLQLPVILVNAPYYTDDFKQVISGLGPSVVIFDEFEKVYHELEAQNNLLTLFDGVFTTESMFILICNEVHKLTHALQNRPSRFFYSFTYQGLESEFIIDYCKDKLDNQEHLQSVRVVSAFFENFNFDMLQSLVEEMNRFKEPAHIAVKYLNIEAEMFKSHEMYEVTCTYNKQNIALRKGQERQKGSPLARTSIQIYLMPNAKQIKLLKDIDYYFYVTPDHITEINTQDGRYIYQYGDFIITYTKSSDSHWRMDGPSPSRLPIGTVEEE